MIIGLENTLSHEDCWGVTIMHQRLPESPSLIFYERPPPPQAPHQLSGLQEIQQPELRTCIPSRVVGASLHLNMPKPQ